MSNKIATIVLAILFTQQSTFAAEIAPENNICTTGSTVIAYFNGVLTNSRQADNNKRRMVEVFGKEAPDGTKIQYELMYNQTNGFEDFVETFEQRFKEQKEVAERYELFFQVVRDTGNWWDKLKLHFVEPVINIDNWIQRLQAGFVRNLTTLLGNPPTIHDYKEHQSRIDNWVLEGKKLLFIPHSQGNLFANAAYDYVMPKLSLDNLKIVHIAPASPSVHGRYVLADQDLVINVGLRMAGSVPPSTHDIPVFKPLGNNHGRDFMGHGLLETYLNPAFTPYNSIKNHVNTALKELKAPPTQASTGFFTATLTWDGSGDVDMHAFEPTGSHVYYQNKQGNSGYLDVDNTQSNGPEHYYASCDKTKLAVGTYDIKLANYYGAEGRNATLQIASSENGVLATKSVIMGAETRNNPVYSMFSVKVVQNPETLKYSVKLE